MMVKKLLDATHVKLQFLMLLISVLSFLILAMFVGEIVWFEDFSRFAILLYSLFGMFIGVLALLRYYSKKESTMFLFLGIGFFFVSILDISQLLVQNSSFSGLFISSSPAYSVSMILSKFILSFFLCLSWLLAFNKKKPGKIDTKTSLLVFFLVLIPTIFLGLASFTSFLLDSFMVILLGILTFVMLLLSLLGILYKKNWLYENFDFWLLFSISFLLLSQIFYLPFLNIEYYNMLNLSVWAQLVGYIGLLVGFLNSIYELYQNEVKTKKELERKNSILEGHKKKVEEGYLALKKEKWSKSEKKRSKKGKE